MSEVSAVEFGEPGKEHSIHNHFFGSVFRKNMKIEVFRLCFCVQAEMALKRLGAVCFLVVGGPTKDACWVNWQFFNKICRVNDYTITKTQRSWEKLSCEIVKHRKWKGKNWKSRKCIVSFRLEMVFGVERGSRKLFSEMDLHTGRSTISWLDYAARRYIKFLLELTTFDVRGDESSENSTRWPKNSTSA